MSIAGGVRRSLDQPATARVAVIVPCLDEAPTIAKVVSDLQAALADATVYVFDNASTDASVARARDAGATVISSPRRGKGNVVRHAFRLIDADAYLLIDGDDTYPAGEAPRLVGPVLRGEADMVVGTRLAAADVGSFRVLHAFGNRLFARLVTLLSGVPLTDVLSGYRALSRELVQVLHVRARAFEVEAELTLQTVAKDFVIQELPIAYGRRPLGSESKLGTWRDGYLILQWIFLLFKDYYPRLFFSIVAALLAIGSLVVGIVPVTDYLRTGLVLHVPRALLAVGLGTLATISFGVGLILDTIAAYQADNVEYWRRLLGDRRQPPPRDDD
jgi:glycosyltransferase involved in cell wall biosynthesis